MRLHLRVHFKTELFFKLHMLMHLFVYTSAKNNSMKRELKGLLYVALEDVPQTFFQGALRVAQKSEEKDTFDVLIDSLLDNAIEGVFEDAPKDALDNLSKDAHEATATCESKQNFVNILNFTCF